jgi:acyl carrier protein
MTPVDLAAAAVADEIRAKVVALASALGVDARQLADTDLIPERAGLDSAAIMELIVWYEHRFGLEIDQEDLTLENFGTVDAMVRYVHAHRK